MYRLLRSHLTAGELDRAIGDDFVGVHVGLRAGAGLPDAQGKKLVEFSLDNFVGGLYDQLGLVGGELAEIAIYLGASLLEQAEGADDGARHPIVSDREVQQRAF